MGGKCSKHSFPGWDAIRERMRRTGPRERRNEPAAEGVGAASRDLEQRGAITTSNTASNNAACAWLEAQEEEEVGCFPVPPLVPLRPMTYGGAFHLRLFLKEGGGLGRLIYSQKRQDLLDLWIYNPRGYFPDWHNSPPGPGTLFPLTFGWCFKLLPVEPDEVEEATEGNNNCLLHPINLHGMDDPEGVLLLWIFNRLLAFHHMAREKHPEYFNGC
uniref:Protein Nef n=1 Tax=Human immunodeficiency virus type 1 TaxID=11676 RepID=A0A0B5GN30_HV1|nr:nef protein [Human immunodeficiency virus 1]